MHAHKEIFEMFGSKKHISIQSMDREMVLSQGGIMVAILSHSMTQKNLWLQRTGEREIDQL